MAQIQYDNFQKTLKLLESMNEYYNSEISGNSSLQEQVKEALAESVIHRFMLCWNYLVKTLKHHLSNTGYSDVPSAPKELIRFAYKEGIIATSPEKWFKYLEVRNTCTHHCSSEKAQESRQLMDDFIADAKDLYETMSKESWA